MTEQRFKLVRFDRSGPEEYPWINIHTQATTFIQCIMLIAGQDLQKLGFDPTIYYNEDGVRCIDVIERKATAVGQLAISENITFENVRPLYHSRSIRGPGEVGWAGKRKGCPNGPEMLIVDRLVHIDRLGEREIDERIEAAGVEGVVHLEIWQPRNLEITTGKGRFGDGALIAQDNGDEFPNLVLTRVVTKKYPSLTAFASKLQLLEVVRDSVLGTPTIIRIPNLYSPAILRSSSRSLEKGRCASPRPKLEHDPHKQLKRW